MVEKLRPDLLQREVNVKADGVQTAFRKVPYEPSGTILHAREHRCHHHVVQKERCGLGLTPANHAQGSLRCYS